MKKILSLIAIMMLTVMGANAANKTISLVPGPWAADDAVFAAYTWNGDGDLWTPFAEVSGNYVAQVDDSYTGLILVRLKPATAEGFNTDNSGLNWDNKWNQTDDIDFTAVANGSTFTITGWGGSDYTATNPIDDLKDKLGKAIVMADLFDLDTTAAATALANPDATEADLKTALTNLVQTIVPKAQETITLARKFFEKFDSAAGAALEPSLAAAETALGGTDFQAMYEAAMALFAQGLVEGQRAMAKVSGYLEKMENETVNTDLAAINTAVAANDLNAVLAALRQMKNDLPDAAQAYAVQVQTLIDQGKDAGKDVSAMETALSSAMTAYLQYKMKKADLVDVGYALYVLIKAVEEYKAAQAVVTIESMVIVGDFLGLEATEEDTEPNWNPANGWAMTQDTENTAIWTLTKRFTAEAKTYEYKATANGNWTDYVLPKDDNAKETFDTAGKYILTFTADTENHTLNLNVEPVVTVEFPADAIVYDFEAAAAAGENPANLNGSAANGQAFYGWEKSDKTDSKRQDYKGYTWAEGSVLPEACHVWRRSDRINGNMTEGGLKCPNNREVAVDGLKAGDKVIIVYDAVDATDKNIIWAIGDGTSEGGPGTDRATATIDGTDAVIGETTIASGAEILVNSVTPAENGTGYIVFQIKKNMIINQIAIIPGEEPAAVPYYLVGNMTEWGPKAEYQLVKNEEAETEEYMITVDLTTTSQFKIAKSEDGVTIADEDWYPTGMGNSYGENGEITADGNYTVYFRPNADGGEDWFYKVIYVASNETDGINAVSAADQNAVVYNLAGQKVMKAQKGLYIVNGKKVVLK